MYKRTGAHTLCLAERYCISGRDFGNLDKRIKSIDHRS